MGRANGHAGRDRGTTTAMTSSAATPGSPPDLPSDPPSDPHSTLVSDSPTGVAAPAAGEGSRPLSQRLREETTELHRQAERAGIMFELLRGRLERPAYVALLRDLLEVYVALEERLEETAGAGAVQGIHDRALYRVGALRADLASLHGVRWEAEVSPGDAACEYAARVRGAAPLQLAMHAWVRYLGDLSGGQALGAVIARVLALPGGAGGDGVAFYRFPDIGDVASYKLRFRAALDAIPLAAGDADRAVREAQEAFRLNVRVFEDVARRTAPSVAPPQPPGA